MFEDIKLAFDIGACDGGYATGLLERGVNKVVCVEPNPTSFSRIQSRFGNDDRIIALNNAASSTDGETLTFYVSEKHPPISTATKAWVESSRFANNRDENGVPYEWGREVEAQTVNIDGLISRYGVPQFIKVDTEGFEDSVVKGLSTHHENMILTFEIAEELVSVTYSALDHLNSIGYSNVGIVEGDDISTLPAKYHTYNEFKDKMDKIFPSPSGEFFGMIFVKG